MNGLREVIVILFRKNLSWPLKLNHLKFSTEDINLQVKMRKVPSILWLKLKLSRIKQGLWQKSLPILFIQSPPKLLRLWRKISQDPSTIRLKFKHSLTIMLYLMFHKCLIIQIFFLHKEFCLLHLNHLHTFLKENHFTK